MKKTLELEISPEKLIKRINSRINKTTFASRIKIGDGKTFFGSISKNRISVYCPKKNVTALFSANLNMHLEKKDKKTVCRYYFSRCGFVNILFSIASATGFLSFLLYITEDTVFSLSSLVFGAVCILPLFVFSKSKKELLLSIFSEEKPTDGDNNGPGSEIK